MAKGMSGGSIGGFVRDIAGGEATGVDKAEIAGYEQYKDDLTRSAKDAAANAARWANRDIDIEQGQYNASKGLRGRAIAGMGDASAIMREMATRGDPAAEGMIRRGADEAAAANMAAIRGASAGTAQMGMTRQAMAQSAANVANASQAAAEANTRARLAGMGMYGQQSGAIASQYGDMAQQDLAMQKARADARLAQQAAAYQRGMGMANIGAGLYGRELMAEQERLAKEAEIRNASRNADVKVGQDILGAGVKAVGDVAGTVFKSFSDERVKNKGKGPASNSTSTPDSVSPPDRMWQLQQQRRGFSGNALEEPKTPEEFMAARRARGEDPTAGVTPEVLKNKEFSDIAKDPKPQTLSELNGVSDWDKADNLLQRGDMNSPVVKPAMDVGSQVGSANMAVNVAPDFVKQKPATSVENRKFNLGQMFGDMLTSNKGKRSIGGTVGGIFGGFGDAISSTKRQQPKAEEEEEIVSDKRTKESPERTVDELLRSLETQPSPAKFKGGSDTGDASGLVPGARRSAAQADSIMRQFQDMPEPQKFGGRYDMGGAGVPLPGEQQHVANPKSTPFDSLQVNGITRQLQGMPEPRGFSDGYGGAGGAKDAEAVTGMLPQPKRQFTSDKEAKKEAYVKGVQAGARVGVAASDKGLQGQVGSMLANSGLGVSGGSARKQTGATNNTGYVSKPIEIHLPPSLKDGPEGGIITLDENAPDFDARMRRIDEQIRAGKHPVYGTPLARTAGYTWDENTATWMNPLGQSRRPE